MSARQTLEQYLLSQTSVNEYLPRNKMAAVTQLPIKLLDDLYAKIVFLDRNVQDQVRLDIVKFIDELRPMVNKVIGQARHTIVEEQEQLDNVQLADYGDHGTAIDESKLSTLSEQVSRELQRRTNMMKSRQNRITKAIQQISEDLNQHDVEVAPRDVKNLDATTDALETLLRVMASNVDSR